MPGVAATATPPVRILNSLSSPRSGEANLCTHALPHQSAAIRRDRSPLPAGGGAGEAPRLPCMRGTPIRLPRPTPRTERRVLSRTPLESQISDCFPRPHPHHPASTRTPSPFCLLPNAVSSRPPRPNAARPFPASHFPKIIFGLFLRPHLARPFLARRFCQQKPGARKARFLYIRGATFYVPLYNAPHGAPRHEPDTHPNAQRRPRPRPHPRRHPQRLPRPHRLHRPDHARDQGLPGRSCRNTRNTPRPRPPRRAPRPHHNPLAPLLAVLDARRARAPLHHHQITRPRRNHSARCAGHPQLHHFPFARHQPQPSQRPAPGHAPFSAARLQEAAPRSQGSIPAIFTFTNSTFLFFRFANPAPIYTFIYSASTFFTRTNYSASSFTRASPMPPRSDASRRSRCAEIPQPTHQPPP